VEEAALGAGAAVLRGGLFSFQKDLGGWSLRLILGSKVGFLGGEFDECSAAGHELTGVEITLVSLLVLFSL
jgi:hypothetical protein